MKQPFDLIFIDPPTFSNNKTKKRMFDIQKDYGTLLCLAAAILAKNGTIIFSTNFRKFEMEPDLLPELKIEDITKDTISPDFQRNKRIHYCWQITKITK
jgi:23S rRNA (guanine2445-N2)-methyltransferase / 23S rRNA (guanine2069-N7)-methyltransferase